MNEFEKDENLEQTQTEAAVEKEEEINQDSADELQTELEGIRDMLQQELDKALEDNTQEDYAEEGMVIQELDEITEEDEAEENDEDIRICECCGENECSQEYGEDYPYCDECRELMKKYPFRKSGILTAVIMLIFLCASVYFGYSYLSDVSLVVDASANFNAGYNMNAMQSYYSYFNGAMTGKNPSLRAVKETAEAFTKAGYFSDAAGIITTYYTESQLNLPWNKGLKDIVEQTTELTESYYAISEVAKAPLSGAEFDYDAVISALDALKDVNPSEEGTGTIEAYNRVFIEYYKYVVMSVNGESVETQLEQLRLTDEIGEGYEWAYLANYCAVAAMAGDKELVDSCFDRLMKINKQDTAAYIAKAAYYRYLETPDADAIIEICNQAAENVYTSDTSYVPYYAIAYLIKGEGALALEKMEALMNSGSYSVQACNLYALCGIYNGNEELYGEMKALLANYGYTISDTVTDYKEGKITLLEALQDKGGDI